MERKRIIYFDFLKIFAILAVVMLHVSARQYNLTGVYHYIACFWEGIVWWGVPIFVMISGALFLEPTKIITINSIFRKYIFRMAVLFIIWSLFYTGLSCISQNNFNFYFIIKHSVVFSGYSHLWFLYMIAGLYLITPLLRPIIEKKDKNLLLYLLVIWFVMASIIPFIKFIFPSTEKFFNVTINNLNLYFPLSYLGYFVLGYYLHNYVNIKKNFLIILTLLCCLMISVFGDIYYSSTQKQSFFLNTLSPFVIITAISIFLLLKNKCLKIKQNNTILQLSNLTLGVYLIHPFFIRIAEKLNLFNKIYILLNDNNFFTILIIFIAVNICSFFSVYLLKKIPIIKKYCV